MSALIFLGVAAAGGFGAAARMLLDGLVRSRVAVRYPVGTTVINLTGSFALGTMVGLASIAVIPDTWYSLIGTGFLGGYTTFSTASFETVRLIQERRAVAAIVSSVGLLLASVALAAGGMTLVTVVSRTL